jgi:dipeptidyl aminopeptidase/acylaminoacyl peptidase
MTVSAPPRPPTPAEPVDRDGAEVSIDALIEEARERTRRRRRRYAGAAVLLAIGSVAVYAGFGGGRATEGESGHPRPAVESVIGPLTAGGGVLTIMDLNAIERDSGWYAVSTIERRGRLRAVVRCPGDANWCGQILSADWSPDGRRLALSATSYALENPANGLHVIDVVTGRDRMLSVHSREGDRYDLDWSPDGLTLAYATDDGIYLLDVDGNSASRRLVTGDRPTWSPDGRWIAFSRIGHDGRRSIRVIRVDGSDARTLVSWGSAPAWSPDGRRIAYRLGCKILMTSPTGADVTPPRLRRCIDFAGPAVPWGRWFDAAVWSPDGTKLAFVSNVRGTFIMNADGTELQRIADGLLACACGRRPAWRPIP